MRRAMRICVMAGVVLMVGGVVLGILGAILGKGQSQQLIQVAHSRPGDLGILVIALLSSPDLGAAMWATGVLLMVGSFIARFAAGAMKRAGTSHNNSAPGSDPSGPSP